MFEAFEGMLLLVGPDPGFTFLSEQVEGGNNVGKVWDELPVEVCKLLYGRYLSTEDWPMYCQS